MADKAVSIADTTTMGCFRTPYPRLDGNHFSVNLEDGRKISVGNMVYENLEELIRRGEISFPIEVYVPAGSRNGFITDSRVPMDWMSERFLPT
jgi:hypothetical protein